MKSRTDRDAPTRLTLLRENEEPSPTKSKTANVAPILVNPSSAKDEPKRDMLRRDNEAPTKAKDRTDMDEPNRIKRLKAKDDAR
jgi:hypothetical protein